MHVRPDKIISRQNANACIGKEYFVPLCFLWTLFKRPWYDFLRNYLLSFVRAFVVSLYSPSRCCYISYGKCEPQFLLTVCILCISAWSILQLFNYVYIFIDYCANSIIIEIFPATNMRVNAELMKIRLENVLIISAFHCF